MEAAETNSADAIGMSGLLVKSTMVMKDNLAELDAQGLGTKYPILLGGAALTRAYVEHDLNDAFTGDVRYAKDAFEGLALMDAAMAVKRCRARRCPRSSPAGCPRGRRSRSPNRNSACAPTSPVRPRLAA